MRIVCLLGLFLTACSTAGLGGTTGPGGVGPDGGPATGCTSDSDCIFGEVCEAGICVTPPMTCSSNADCPPGILCVDGICDEPEPSACGVCPAPNRCIDDVCTPPEESSFCVRDIECEEEFLCIGGMCRPDPRITRSCDDPLTPPDFTAGVDHCECVYTADCVLGTRCLDGDCVPDGCIADEECPRADDICEAGECILTCDVVHPDLSTDPVWNVSSVYNFREALPDWLSSFLDAVAGPFRFLAGDSEDPDLGLPGFIEDAIGDAIRRWAEDNLPPYALAAFGGIADLNDILSTWIVEERMHLTPGAELDQYRGENEWVQVAFEYRGMMMVGTPEDIIGWSARPDEYDAQAVCGTLNIETHDVEIGIGAIIAWALDVVVYESSDGRYDDLEMMADEISSGLCSEARNIAEGIYSGAGGLAESWCLSTIADLVDDMIMAINDALLRLDLVRLRGFATIVDGNVLRPGTWEGSLVGGDFGGTWSADR